jgi:hypothetical protein
MKHDSLWGSGQIIGAVPPGYAGDDDGKYRDHLFEQYKLFVEKTHEYWDQFLSTNEFFLKINSVALTAFAWLASSRTRIPVPVLAILLLVSLALAAEWFRVVNALRQLNAARHEVIEEWELYLPAQPYRYEYKKLYEEPGRHYHAVQRLYRALPVIAAAAYVTLTGLIVFGVSLPGKR